VVRDGGGPHRKVGGEVVHVVLSVQQVPHDAQTGFVSQQLQDCHCTGDVIGAGLFSYMCIHLNTCIAWGRAWQPGRRQGIGAAAVRRTRCDRVATQGTSIQSAFLRARGQRFGVLPLGDEATGAGRRRCRTPPSRGRPRRRRRRVGHGGATGRATQARRRRPSPGTRPQGCGADHASTWPCDDDCDGPLILRPERFKSPVSPIPEMLGSWARRPKGPVAPRS
jgi:hypothetical protein